MLSKFTTTNGNTTVSFDWTAPTATIQNIVGGCAEALWNRGMGDHGTAEVPILFSSLTNTQKLSLVDDYLKQVVLDLANQNKLSKAEEVTRMTEQTSQYTL